MSKINFQNLPNTTTPVNGTNLNSIQVKECACFQNAGAVQGLTSDSRIPLTTVILNNTNGKVIANSNGTFTINYTGYVKVSFNIWIHSTATSRPWLRLRRNGIVISDVLDDLSSTYGTFSIANCIVGVSSGDYIEVICSTQNGETFDVDYGVGYVTSYITIELL